jgi:integrase
MTSVYQRGGKWYLRCRDHQGRWKDRVSTATTKTEANRMAAELERAAERQKMGLVPRPRAHHRWRWPLRCAPALVARDLL